MKIKFDAPNGQRLKNRFTGFEAINCQWMWNCDKKEWTQNIERGKYTYCSHRYCYSIKAFKRMLKTAPSGVAFMLWSKYEGYHAYGFGKK